MKNSTKQLLSEVTTPQTELEILVQQKIVTTKFQQNLLDKYYGTTDRAEIEAMLYHDSFTSGIEVKEQIQNIVSLLTTEQI